MTLALFAFIIFQIGSCFHALASQHGGDSPIYASNVAGITGAYHYTQLFIG
jgi:hypothetical protein